MRFEVELVLDGATKRLVLELVEEIGKSGAALELGDGEAPTSLDARKVAESGSERLGLHEASDDEMLEGLARERRISESFVVEAHWASLLAMAAITSATSIELMQTLS